MFKHLQHTFIEGPQLVFCDLVFLIKGEAFLFHHLIVGQIYTLRFTDKTCNKTAGPEMQLKPRLDEKNEDAQSSIKINFTEVKHCLIMC